MSPFLKTRRWEGKILHYLANSYWQHDVTTTDIVSTVFGVIATKIIINMCIIIINFVIIVLAGGLPLPHPLLTLLYICCPHCFVAFDSRI